MGLVDALPVTPADIDKAAERIAPHAVRTTLIYNPKLNEETGARVLLKPENLQRTGSFKFRGAMNAIKSLSPADRENGVIAWSSGNHAQAVAAAAKLLGLEATIVMPADAPRTKIEATHALGAQIVPYDRYTESREKIGQRIARARGLAIIPPYDHPPTIAGQGTAGREIAADLQSLNLKPDIMLVCCGGGGLTAGTAIALKAVWPEVEVFSVEPEGLDDTMRSLVAGKRVANDPDARSICDALLAPEPGAITFEINRRLLAGGMAVCDEAVLSAMRYAFRNLKLVLEPGGAAALAALRENAIDMRGKTVVVMLSGGNVDPGLYATALCGPDFRPQTAGSTRGPV